MALREFGKGSRLPRQPLQHQADHGHLDERLASLHQPLLVLAQTAIPHQSGECALHDPPVGQDGETFAIRAPTTPLDDLQFPLARSVVRRLLVIVTETRVQRYPRQPGRGVLCRQQSAD